MNITGTGKILDVIFAKTIYITKIIVICLAVFLLAGNEFSRIQAAEGCWGDYDKDGDIDGLDISAFFYDIPLSGFAESYGRTETFCDNKPLVHYQFNLNDQQYPGGILNDHGSLGINARVGGPYNRINDDINQIHEAFQPAGNTTPEPTQAPTHPQLNEALNNEMTITVDFKENCPSGCAALNREIFSFYKGGLPVIKAFVRGSSNNQQIWVEANLNNTGKKTAKAFLRNTGGYDPDDWTNLAVTIQDRTLKIFINGVQRALLFGNEFSELSFETLYLWEAVQYYGSNLAIGDFRIYDKALKAKQIRALSDKLVVHYPLNLFLSNSNGSNANDSLGLFAYHTSFDGIGTDLVSGANRYTQLPYYDPFNPLTYFTTLDFSSDSYIDVPYSSSLNPSPQFTVSAWVKPNENHITLYRYKDIYDTGTVVSSVSSSGGTKKGYILGQYGDHWSFWAGTGTGSWHRLDSNQGVIQDEWIHIVGIYDGNTLHLYINGQPDNSESVSSFEPNTNQFLRIGAGANELLTPDNYFNGSVDDVRIFARALSQDDVDRLYKDSRYVRGYVDCTYPYEDCNPAMWDVKEQFKKLCSSQTTSHSYFDPVDGTDGIDAHYQGLVTFLPPFGSLAAASRSDTNADWITSESFYTDWESNRAHSDDIIVDHAADPDNKQFIHGGGMQGIGKYFYQALDRNPKSYSIINPWDYWGDGASATGFRSDLYSIDDLGEIQFVSTFSHESNEHFTFHAYTSIMKIDIGNYILLNGYYDKDSISPQKHEVHAWVTQVDDLSTISSILPLNTYIMPFMKFDIAGNSSEGCDNNYAAVTLADGSEGTLGFHDYQHAFFFTQSDGRIFLIFNARRATAYDSNPVIYELIIDKMDRCAGSKFQYVWGNPTSTDPNYQIESDKGNFSGTADFFVDENGMLEVRTLQNYDGAAGNVDYDIIK